MSHTFLRHIALNAVNAAVLERWDALGLPDGWLVAGCLFQSVWNLQAGRPPGEGIKDYDLFYFDSSDLSEESEKRVQARVDNALSDLGVAFEVANQARVHLWYPSYFGRAYAPLASSKEGIARFLVLETCVGVRPNEVHAPYGLAGVYAGTLSRNPLTPYPELFRSKVASYRSRWPQLKEGEAAYCVS
jgi:hypothetical protein